MEQQVHQYIDQALGLIKSNDLSQAMTQLIEAKRLQMPVQDLDYVRGLCFVRMGRLGDAREALKEELRHFPTNEAAEKLLQDVMAEEAKTSNAAPSSDDTEFNEMLEVIRPYTMLPINRLFSLYQLTKQICQRNIPGNFVECGVAGGGSTALMLLIIQKYSQSPRTIFACDSYEGMPKPSAEDTLENVAADDTGWGTGTCAAPESSVKEICEKIGMSQHLRVVKGYFENTLPEVKQEMGQLAFLHIDCDWYESTKTILHELYDQVTPGTAIQVDDYGYWDGVGKALHEFEQVRGLNFSIEPLEGAAWFQKP